MQNKKLLLLASMPRSGSTWILRLLNELWVVGGAKDYKAIRSQYHLEKFITVGSGLVEMSLPHMLPVLRPLRDGYGFTVKTHGCPSKNLNGYLTHYLLKRYVEFNQVIIIYLIRDPRDAVLSGFEYGQRSVKSGSPNAFAESFISIEAGINWMAPYLSAWWPYWSKETRALKLRYEDLITQFDVEYERILTHLALDRQSDRVQAVREKYRAGAKPQVGMHFYKGEIGRYEQEMTPLQLQLCDQHFSPFLGKMGYRWDKKRAQ